MRRPDTWRKGPLQEETLHPRTFTHLIETRFPVAYLASLRNERLFASMALLLDNARETGSSKVAVCRAVTPSAQGDMASLCFIDDGHGFTFQDILTMFKPASRLPTVSEDVVRYGDMFVIGTMRTGKVCL